MNITISGEKVKTARHAAGLSLRELGLLVGCSAMHLSLIERGQSRASEAVLNRLSKALQIPVNILMRSDS